MIDWGILVLPGAVLLIIPIAIIAGYRRSMGSIMMSGALATFAFAAFWLVFGGTTNVARNLLASGILLYGGVLLALATWVLSLNAAAQTRRWGWVAALLVAGYLTVAAMYASFSLPPCFSGPGDEFTCPSPDQLRQLLLALGYLACPVVGLVYGIRVTGRHARKPPQGLVISPLGAEPPLDAARTDSGPETAES